MKNPVRLGRVLALTGLWLLSACGDGGSNPPPTATPTHTTAVAPSRTPTSPGPTATATLTGSVSLAGLVIVRSELAADDRTELGAPPAQWMSRDDAHADDKALAHADWRVEGSQARSGTTAEDGSFVIDQLLAGEYQLHVSKTLGGDLVDAATSFVVSADGPTRLVLELERGLVRATVTYRDGNEEIQQVTGPDQSHATVRSGALVEVGNVGRNFTDPDGDGQFVPDGCDQSVWRCNEANACEGEGRACQCIASCPFCEDCGGSVCSLRTPYSPYRCDSDSTCKQPGDRCVCVASCPDCDDCSANVCVPACEPITLRKLTIVGPQQVVLGRTSTLRALAEIDDGSSIDVTYLVTWQSSDPSLASIDAWGIVTPNRIGSVAITATLADLGSEPVTITVVEHPQLQRIEIQVAPCYYPFGRPTEGGGVINQAPAADILPHPFCNDVVRVGRSVALLAWGYYADGQTEQITESVAWTVEPAQVGEISDGVFTGFADGNASIRASIGAVRSEPLVLRVVSQLTLVQLSIYPSQGAQPPVFFPVFEDDPRPADAPIPCFECGSSFTTLVGGTSPFVATARYDTGEWEDVTKEVSWHSSDGGVASVDMHGVLSALAAGDTTVSATLSGVDSNPVNVRVVSEATLLNLYIYQEGSDRVVEKLGNAFFGANGDYDVGFSQSVTQNASWHTSDETVGGFDQPGVFVGRAAGEVDVWAELDGKESNRLHLSVFERSDISYCDPTNINRGEWSDAFNRVVLESDCAHYTPPASVELRFTVSERERPLGIFDPCLDLYVLRNGLPIRTIREEGCGEPFLAAGAPGFEDAAVRYQQKAFWDLKDNQGALVGAGRYTIVGRFYLYYDPVVSIDVDVFGGSGLF